MSLFETLRSDVLELVRLWDGKFRTILGGYIYVYNVNDATHVYICVYNGMC